MAWGVAMDIPVLIGVVTIVRTNKAKLIINRQDRKSITSGASYLMRAHVMNANNLNRRAAATTYHGSMVASSASMGKNNGWRSKLSDPS